MVLVEWNPFASDVLAKFKHFETTIVSNLWNPTIFNKQTNQHLKQTWTAIVNIQAFYRQLSLCGMDLVLNLWAKSKRCHRLALLLILLSCLIFHCNPCVFFRVQPLPFCSTLPHRLHPQTHLFSIYSLVPLALCQMVCVPTWPSSITPRSIRLPDLPLWITCLISGPLYRLLPVGYCSLPLTTWLLTSALFSGYPLGLLLTGFVCCGLTTWYRTLLWK